MVLALRSRIELRPPQIVFLLVFIPPTYTAKRISTRCQLDGSSFVDCKSPQSYDRLERGYHHVFGVRMVGENEIRGPPAVFLWQVDEPIPQENVIGRSNGIHDLRMWDEYNGLEFSDCNRMKVTTQESNQLGGKYAQCDFDQNDYTGIEQKANPQRSEQEFSPRTNTSITNLVLPLPF